MRNFSGGGFRGGNGGQRSNYSNKGWGGDRDRGEVSMHHATCSECGNDCQVPFRPTGSKPVYCNDCFGSKKGAGKGRDFGGRPAKREFDSKSFSAKPAGVSDEVKKQLNEINSKIDRLFTMMEKITSVKVEKVISEVTPKVAEKKVAKVKAVKEKPVAVKAPAKKVVAKKKK